MNEQNDAGGERPSSYRISAGSAGWAVLIRFIATILLALILGCARVFFDVMDNRTVNLLETGKLMITGIPGLSLCVGPIVFFPSFALLQRMRVKY